MKRPQKQKNFNLHEVSLGSKESLLEAIQEKLWSIYESELSSLGYSRKEDLTRSILKEGSYVDGVYSNPVVSVTVPNHEFKHQMKIFEELKQKELEAKRDESISTHRNLLEEMGLL